MSIFNPLVSIVIPVYNGSNYLKEAIDSALAQTYKNIEVIVINDGSNDEKKTEKICKSFGNKIRYFYKDNGGVATALNLGIKESNGQYFSWLSHDDLFKPNKIEKQIEFFKNNHKAKVVCSAFEILNTENSQKEPRKLKDIDVIKKCRGVLEKWLDFCTFLVDIQCFNQVGLFNLELKTVQDFDMQLRLVAKYPIFYIDDILSTRREHASQGTKTQLKFHLKELDAYILNSYKKYDKKQFQKDSENNFTTYFNLAVKTMKMSCKRTARHFYFKALLNRPISPKLLLLVLFGKRAFNTFYKSEIQ